MIRRYEDIRQSDVLTPDGKPTMGIAVNIQTSSGFQGIISDEDPEFTIFQARSSVYDLVWTEELDPLEAILRRTDYVDHGHTRQSRTLTSPPRNDRDVDAWGQIPPSQPDRLPIWTASTTGDIVLIDGEPVPVFDGRPLADFRMMPALEQNFSWEDLA